MTTQAQNDFAVLGTFGALGSIVGYLGADIACPSVYSRFLWPTRYYNSSNPFDLFAIALLMPMGGPMYKAAITVLERFEANDLFKGRLRGTMLGTAFFDDLCLTYRDESGKAREVRNGLWVRVLRLVDWTQDGAACGRKEITADDHVAIRAMRPVLWLCLCSCEEAICEDSSTLTISEGSESIGLWCIVGVFMSELVTLAVGMFVALYWKSFFSIWFAIPTVLKGLALYWRVTREHFIDSSGSDAGCYGNGPGAPISSEPETHIFQVDDTNKGVLVIEGRESLVRQFFRHYGHPQRHCSGIGPDYRVREVVTIGLLAFSAVHFPMGLVAFVFAPQGVQWAWLAYQLYVTFVMYIYRFCGGKSIGSTEQQIARGLSAGKTVLLKRSANGSIAAKLKVDLFNNIADAAEDVDRCRCSRQKF